MSKHAYQTAPQSLSTMPPGIPYIVGNEAAERFSFYGMKAILTVYLTKHLLDWQNQSAVMSPEDAKSTVHLFVASAYFFPVMGAIISDWFFGKYRTILWLSIVYCLGHLLLAVVPGREGLVLGLLLIAIGAGGIKPCVSAHVGDQFGEKNQHLLSKVFGWFYFSINFGAFFSTLLTPWLLKVYGPHVAFGVPGVLMALATFVFWLGRNKFVHIPAGGTEFIRESFSSEGLLAIMKLIPLYLFISVFWALYDQTASAWVLQADNMDRRWAFGGQAGEWQSSQIQAVNPILVLALIPLFSYVVYPALNAMFKLTPLKKIGIGFFVTAVAFSISGWIESKLEPLDAEAAKVAAEREVKVEEVVAEQVAANRRLHIGWQVLAYFVLTCAEVMVSITGLEFSYTQAPNKMKSLIMSLYMLSVSLGNLLTSAVNQLIQNGDGTTWLPGASYYWFFTVLQAIAAVLFIFVAASFPEKTYIQETTAAEPSQA
ncbi:MAG TPA: POT family MFS transporter [Planctomycetaceae bacterium]|nr:POT family MFS transporter [Planctomycetaceae bacterium]